MVWVAWFGCVSQPDYTPPAMRLVVGNAGPRFNRTYSTHDLVLVPELCCSLNDTTVYEKLLAELKVRTARVDRLECSVERDFNRHHTTIPPSPTTSVAYLSSTPPLLCWACTCPGDR